MRILAAAIVLMTFGGWGGLTAAGVPPPTCWPTAEMLEIIKEFGEETMASGLIGQGDPEKPEMRFNVNPIKKTWSFVLSYKGTSCASNGHSFAASAPGRDS